MSSLTPDVENTEKGYSADEILNALWTLLALPKSSDFEELFERYRDDEALQKIMRYLLDLRELSNALSKGDLEKLVYSKGYILSNLKALQSNLRHLTWQTEKIAEGDFSQRIDFLGEFSESFNRMTAELRDYNERLTHQATIDQLTQLPNRSFLMPFLSQCFNKYMRDHEDFAVLLIDIDLFKNINDSYGHDAGDMVLVQLSRILSEKFRSSDVFSRYGGEEFLAVLIDTNVEGAKIIAERLLKTVRNAAFNLPGDLCVSITISIGISQTKADDSHYESIIKRSDMALYIAKENGRNQVAAL